ncbi:MAG: hypothetical protein A2020_01320 [Lentisphaerae bacterium GWF2_45_14]|nr:MAG: hypothetical protein A2020_01320 [Lentisphaerae bacterium GWF2_45_14]
MSEKKKTIVLGVTGSIAAYKAAELCSKLSQSGHEVHVIMTASAVKLVTEQTFLTLSRNQVISSLWDIPDWKPGHISLAERAALLVIAPCTANFIGKMASGIADDALSTYVLAHAGKVLLAPAMNPRMWANRIVEGNCAKLKEAGIEFIGPGKGKVACGDKGEGRMSEVPELLCRIKELLQ